MRLKNLLDNLAEYNKESDLRRIRRAYKYAERIYQEQTRASGNTQLHHTLAAALHLSELKADDDAIIACLLHHAKPVHYDEIEEKFGAKVKQLLEGLETLSVLRKKGSALTTGENVRKVLLASIKDIRILFIKLCEKLHNMQTLEHLSLKEQKEVAKECLDIYAPLAYRLGLGKLKSELEDAAFKYVDKKNYEKIVTSLEQTKEKRQQILKQVLKQTNKGLGATKIEYEVYGRTKHLYSIYKKIENRNYAVEHMFDLVALRIITKSIEECYLAIKVIHGLYKPIPTRFKDYIASPKPNGYQSLHTVVYGPTNTPIEFQVRTKEMHLDAEEGGAIHWGYKGVGHNDKKFDKKLSWLKQSLQQDAPQIDFFAEHIFVFTPKGEVIQLPKRATPLDFAYAVHTKVGDTCDSAIVNGKIAPFKQELRNGDVVKINTKKTATPSREWLRAVKTTKARQKIRAAIRAKGKIPPRTIQKTQESTEEVRMQLLNIKNMHNPTILFAKCCTLLPGDKIVANIRGKEKVVVHKKDCATYKEKKAKKKVQAEWKQTFSPPVLLYINGRDRIGFFAEVLNMVAAQNVGINNAQGKSLEKDVQLHFEVDIDNIHALMNLIERIKKIEGVKTVRLGEIK